MEADMTEFLDVAGGRIAYDVTGEGPLVVLSHGIGDRRQAYRFLAPTLAQAGYRVANADLRGHGESSLGWASITRPPSGIGYPAVTVDCSPNARRPPPVPSRPAPSDPATRTGQCPGRHAQPA